MYQVAQICYLVHSWPGGQLMGAIALGDRGRLPFIHQAADKRSSRKLEQRGARALPRRVKDRPH
jgi:hypothetical protein